MSINQLNIFKDFKEQPVKRNILQLSFDGASKSNPGPASAGICIKKNNSLVFTQGFYLGHKTNNQAEYLAFLIGIYFVKQFLESNDILNITSDSELLVNQILGKYRIKNLELQKLHTLAVKFLKNIEFKIEHVLREKNKEADKKANEAIVNKNPLPKEFIELLNEHHINI